MLSDERKNFVEGLQRLFEDVDMETYNRHVEGAEKYGSLKFLGADTLEEALQELYDLINYARYTAVKVKLIQAYLAQQAANTLPTDPQGGFIDVRQFMGKGFEK